ncbi:MAG: tetratricopeptide repeat protein [Candidatus Abyssobacteria bacterium SURF_5]|uniref:Tetratricopeptide repeat protein n=1 Tax=Abyssobacteria bacterium (strain SURF_5) TaxID=2093360 RepID=A0A3A4NEB5_ABYX5|nr:MAG: tetratricopeptide repeat protein [Candidatus Abyssubacteria bacterium SURF_5]
MRRFLYATIAYALLVIALHLIGDRFSPLAGWGFYHLREFPRAVSFTACLLAALVCLPPLNNAVVSTLLKLKRRAASIKLPLSPHVLYLFIALASIGLFWAFRSGNLFLGDGVTVAKVARTDEAFRYYVGGWAGHITSHQVLDYWIGRMMHRMLAQTGFESFDTLALRSCIAGGIFVFAVLEIGHVLFDGLARRIAFSATVFTAGFMQLFFGYVETYSLATAFLALFCLATLLYARGKSPILLPVLLLAFSASLHLLMAGSGLALLFAYVYRSRQRGKFCKYEFAAMAAIPVAVAAVYFLIFHSMGFSFSDIFFPETRKDYEGVFFLGLMRKGYILERYTLFSLPHLIDIANEILLVAPFGLLLCLLSLPLWLTAERRKEPEPWILLLTAAVYLAITLTAAPLLGARKDWDVFAPPWIFITMLGAYLLIRFLPDRRVAGRILLIINTVSLLCAIPWIYSNAQIDLDEYLAHLGKGDFYQREGLDEQALQSYERALEINFSPELAYKTAGLRMKTGRVDGAAEILKQAIREENRSELAIFIEQEDAHYTLGSIYLAQGKHDAAIAQFQRALDLWRFRKNQAFTHAPDVSYHLGIAYLEKGNQEAAEQSLLDSIEAGDVPAAHLALARLYARDPLKQHLARKHLATYVQHNPADDAAAKLLEMLEETAGPPAGER